MAEQDRIRPGVSAGGQFTTSVRNEPQVSLDSAWWQREPATYVTGLLAGLYHEEDPAPEPEHVAAVRSKITEHWAPLGSQRAGELADEVLQAEHLRWAYACDEGFDRAAEEDPDELAGVNIEDFAGSEPDPDGGMSPGYDFRAMADAVADEWASVSYSLRQDAQRQVEAALQEAAGPDRLSA